MSQLTPILHHALPCCGRRPHILALKRVDGATIDVTCGCRGRPADWQGRIRLSPSGRALMVDWQPVPRQEVLL